MIDMLKINVTVLAKRLLDYPFIMHMHINDGEIPRILLPSINKCVLPPEFILEWRNTQNVPEDFIAENLYRIECNMIETFYRRNLARNNWYMTCRQNGWVNINSPDPNYFFRVTSLLYDGGHGKIIVQSTAAGKTDSIKINSDVS